MKKIPPFASPTIPYVSASPVPKPQKPESPLRPPNFYNVRLANAPIFLRRTTVKPPSLNFLDRRSPSPQRHSQSPTREHSPVKQEFFVNQTHMTTLQAEQQQQQPFTPISQPQKQNKPAEHLVLQKEYHYSKPLSPQVVTASIQTKPLQKTHGTQMTPFASADTSEQSGKNPFFKKKTIKNN